MSSTAIPVRRTPLRPSRPAATAAVAAVADAAVLVHSGVSPWKVVVAAAVSVLVWLSAIDLESRLLPDRIVLPTTAGLLFASAMLDPAHAVEHLVAAIGAGGFLFAAALVRPGDLGMGDAKLALLLGALLGRSVFTALLLGFAIFAVLGLTLVARDGRRALKRQLPLGPFLTLGAIAVLLLSSS